MRILVVEDDRLLNNTLCYNLSATGYEVDAALTKSVAERFCRKQEYDLIVLDINLPDGNGFDFCRDIKESRPDTAVIFLTANDMESDMLKGYELGADDYMIKPFETKELVARVKAVLRRYHLPQSAITPNESSKCVTYPDLVVNLDNYSVTYYKKSVEMPPKELELLYFLASAPNQVFTREQLLDNIWGYDYIGDTRTVDVHIKRIPVSYTHLTLPTT